jgi:hypothetical protein
MPYAEISEQSETLMRLMSGERAERYVGEILLPTLQRSMRVLDGGRDGLCAALRQPYECLRALLGCYAFSRRGRERSELSGIAIEGLQRACRPEGIQHLLAQEDASLLWESFSEVCREHGRKPMEQLNRGVIAGLTELAQEIYRADGNGSVAVWVAAGVHETARIESQFLRMVDIRGVGPKVSSLFMRDMVYIFNLEEQLDHVDRLYVQPMDKWIRLIAPYIIDEVEPGEAADWVLAGKIAKYTRHGGISGIAFNMGANYFGAREVRDAESFDRVIRQALNQPASLY